MIHVVVDGIVYGLQRYGGINTYFNQVLPRLAQRGDTEVDLFVPRRPMGQGPAFGIRRLARDFLPSRTGISWRLDRALEPVFERLRLAGIRAWASTHSPAVFHSTYFTSLPAPIPCVGMVHDMNHETFPQFYADARGTWLRRQYPAYLRKADRVITVSESTKRQVVRHYGIDPTRIDVVYHGVDRSTFYVEHPDASSGSVLTSLGIRMPYVLYVGGRWHYKNFSIVLEIMPELHRRHGLGLVVVGSAWDEKERVEIPRHPAAAVITLVPFPDDNLLRTLYNNAHAFVFPSLQEGFGIPLLEAMACGTPVVAADTGVFREVAGSAAMFFNPHDGGDLLHTLEASFDDATRSSYRAWGLEQVTRYSWDRSAAETFRVYQRTLGILPSNISAVY